MQIGLILDDSFSFNGCSFCPAVRSSFHLCAPRRRRVDGNVSDHGHRAGTPGDVGGHRVCGSAHLDRRRRAGAPAPRFDLPRGEICRRIRRRELRGHSGGERAGARHRRRTGHYPRRDGSRYGAHAPRGGIRRDGTGGTGTGRPGRRTQHRRAPKRRGRRGGSHRGGGAGLVHHRRGTPHHPPGDPPSERPASARAATSAAVGATARPAEPRRRTTRTEAPRQCGPGGEIARATSASRPPDWGLPGSRPRGRSCPPAGGRGAR